MIDTLLSGFIGAIIGGYIAGTYSLRATKLAWRLHNETEEEKIKFILQAINLEINQLFKLTNNFFKNIKKVEDQDSYKYFLKSSQNYFSIFERNAQVIGAIKYKKYRSLIIKIYLKYKLFLDTLSLNSFYLEKKLEYELHDKQNEMVTMFAKGMVLETNYLKELIKEIKGDKELYEQCHASYLKKFENVKK